METVVPPTLKDKTDFLIRTTTAVAGIRGTKNIVVTGRDAEGKPYTVFSVTEGKLAVRVFCPDLEVSAPAMQFVADGIRKKWSVEEIIYRGLAAHVDPCALVKACIVLGLNLENLIKSFVTICSGDPEYSAMCTPCVILKCAVEAIRCMKEEEVTAGNFGILMPNLAPILGEMKPGDAEKLQGLATGGITGNPPGYPPTPAQIAAAVAGDAMANIANIIVAVVPDAANDNQNCIGMLGGPAPHAAGATPHHTHRAAQHRSTTATTGATGKPHRSVLRLPVAKHSHVARARKIPRFADHVVPADRPGTGLSRCLLQRSASCCQGTRLPWRAAQPSDRLPNGRTLLRDVT